MSEQHDALVAAVGAKVVESFGACAGAPDDLAAASSADATLRELEDLLTATDGGA